LGTAHLSACRTIHIRRLLFERRVSGDHLAHDILPDAEVLERALRLPRRTSIAPNENSTNERVFVALSPWVFSHDDE